MATAGQWSQHWRLFKCKSRYQSSSDLNPLTLLFSPFCLCNVGLWVRDPHLLHLLMISPDHAGRDGGLRVWGLQSHLSDNYSYFCLQSVCIQDQLGWSSHIHQLFVPKQNVKTPKIQDGGRTWTHGWFKERKHPVGGLHCSAQKQEMVWKVKQCC